MSVPEANILYLVITPPDGSEQVIAVDTEKVTVGRESPCDIRVPDNLVSKLQFSLVFEGGKWRLDDAGSRNGTFLDGKRIANSVALVNGSIVSCGMSRIVCAIGERPTRTSAAMRRIGLATDDFVKAVDEGGTETMFKRFAITINAAFSQWPSVGTLLQSVCDLARMTTSAEAAQVIRLPLALMASAGDSKLPEDAAHYENLLEQRGALIKRGTGNEWYFTLSDRMRLLLYIRGEPTPQQRELVIALCLMTQSLIESTENAEHAVASLRLHEQRFSASGVPAVLIGDSPHAQRLRGILEAEAELDEPICLHGPRGSGRHQLAQALHQASRKRSQYPFVATTVETMPALLAGAPTLEAIAGSGTMVVEEMPKIPPRAVRLIYVRSEPMTGMRNYPVPALSDRLQDVAAMARAILPGRKFTDGAMHALARSRFPQGFLDLRRILAAVPDGETIDESALVFDDDFTLDQAMQGFEKQWIMRALAANGDHRINTAKALGISRQSLSRRLKEWGLSNSDDE